LGGWALKDSDPDLLVVTEIGLNALLDGHLSRSPTSEDDSI
jgi:hypothetical protein